MESQSSLINRHFIYQKLSNAFWAEVRKLLCSVRCFEFSTVKALRTKNLFFFPPSLFSPTSPFSEFDFEGRFHQKKFWALPPLSLRWVTHIPPGPLSTTHLHTVPRGLLLLERAKEREKRREFCGKKGEERTELAGLKMSLSPFPLGERRREREACSTLLLFFSSYCDAISCLHFPTKSKKRKIPLNLLYYVRKRLAHVLSLPGQSNFHSVFFCFYFRGLFVGKTKVHCYSLSLSVCCRKSHIAAVTLHTRSMTVTNGKELCRRLRKIDLQYH